jgi:hypothetical protein
MAIIYTYPKLLNPQGNELIVVSDVNNRNSTRLITLASIAGLIPGTSGCSSAITGINDAGGGVIYSSILCADMVMTSTDGTVSITPFGPGLGVDLSASLAGVNCATNNIIGGVKISSTTTDPVPAPITSNYDLYPVETTTDGEFDCTAVVRIPTNASGCNDVFSKIVVSPSGDEVVASGCSDYPVFVGDEGIDVSVPIPASPFIQWTLECATSTTKGGLMVSATSAPSIASVADSGDYLPVQLYPGASGNDCFACVRVPSEGSIPCATSANIGGFHANVVGIYPPSASQTGTYYPVEITEGAPCTGIVRIPESQASGCTNAWSTILTPDTNTATASGCDDSMSFLVQNTSNLIITSDGDDITFALGCASDLLRGGIKVSGTQGGDAAQPAVSGPYYPVQVDANCVATVRVPSGDSVITDGEFTPVLMTQGGDGTQIVPTMYADSPSGGGIKYRNRKAWYHVVNGVVYIDFYLEFECHPPDQSSGAQSIILAKSLGIGVDDAGTLEPLTFLTGLGDLNVSEPNNATVNISRAECYLTAGGVDTNEWVTMPQTGMLNRYPDNITPGIEPFMWLAGHVYVDVVNNMSMQTAYSPDPWITLTTGGTIEQNPIQYAILAGSMSAVLRAT